jgi:hypothetical protein
VWRHNWLYTWCQAEGWGRWRLGWSWICSGGTVTFFIQTFFICDKVYTHFLYTGQS